MSYHRTTEAQLRVAARWQQADESSRLLTEIPDLQSLRIEIEQSEPGVSGAVFKHTQIIVVASAPALFLFPCGDSRCHEGGHDLTGEILGHLRRRDEKFGGQEACGGQVGYGNCGRVMKYSVTAAYSAK